MITFVLLLNNIALCREFREEYAKMLESLRLADWFCVNYLGTLDDVTKFT